MADCPTTALGVPECAQYIKDAMAAIGEERGDRCEVHVSTAAPLVQGPYETPGYECPHGTVYWVAPTGEQIADWAARRVP